MRTTNDARAGLRRAGVIALAGAATAAPCVLGLGFIEGETTLRKEVLLEAAQYAVVYFILILVPLVMAGRRGLWVPWGLVLAMWLLKFGIDLADRGGMDPRPFWFLPHAVAGWSMFALPFAVATVLLLHGTRSLSPRALVVALGAWLALTAASTAAVWYEYAGGDALNHPLIAWPLAMLLATAPLVLGGWMILRLRRHDSRIARFAGPAAA